MRIEISNPAIEPVELAETSEWTERREAVDRLGFTQNTRRLLRGLVGRGASVRAASHYILRDRGQPNMNKAAGEAAPTWCLMSDGMRMGRQMVSIGQRAEVIYEGFRYTGVQSHMPLTWIVKHAPETWELGRAEDGRALEVTVPDLPPHWRYAANQAR